MWQLTSYIDVKWTIGVFTIWFKCYLATRRIGLNWINVICVGHWRWCLNCTANTWSLCGINSWTIESGNLEIKFVFSFNEKIRPTVRLVTFVQPDSYSYRHISLLLFHWFEVRYSWCYCFAHINRKHTNLILNSISLHKIKKATAWYFIIKILICRPL
jgi:hypothetical protein